MIDLLNSCTLNFSADLLAYSITEGNVGSVFGIKQKTGDIYVAKTLDYETPPTVRTFLQS